MGEHSKYNRIVYVKKYILLCLLINVLKILLTCVFMIMVIDILIEYYHGNITYITNINTLYIIFILGLILTIDIIYNYITTNKLRVLVNEYLNTIDEIERQNLYYIISTYITIHSSFLLKKLKET